MSTATPRLESLLIDAGCNIREVMACIDRGAKGIALLVDDDGRLQATITDGDVRRAILAGTSIDAPVTCLLFAKHGTARTGPIVGLVGMSQQEQLALMEQAGVRQLPLLDDSGRIVALATWDELVPDEQLPVQAVIMAGGFGTRLRPLTDNLPKPMLSIGGRPLLERTIDCLRRAGIHRINVTTHYMPDKIIGYFGTGSDFGVQLNYVSEDQPLGTAGSLRLLGEAEEPLLVINGDILTRIDYRQMLRFHREQNADLTLAVRQYGIKVPYGVVEAHKGYVSRLREKPQYEFLVNAGIYLLEPSARAFIPEQERYDMTDLIERLIEEQRVVASFPIVEYWLDIGKHDDFQQAQRDAAEMRWAS